MYGVASVSTVPADHSSQFTVLLFKRSLVVLCPFLGSSFRAGYILRNSGSGVSLCFSHHLSLLVSAPAVVALVLLLFHADGLRVVCPELSPLSPPP